MREKRRFDELRLRQRRGHLDDGCGREYRGAFVHGPHLAGKPKAPQIFIEEIGPHALKSGDRAQMLDVLVREHQDLPLHALGGHRPALGLARGGAALAACELAGHGVHEGTALGTEGHAAEPCLGPA